MSGELVHFSPVPAKFAFLARPSNLSNRRLISAPGTRVPQLSGTDPRPEGATRPKVADQREPNQDREEGEVRRAMSWGVGGGGAS